MKKLALAIGLILATTHLTASCLWADAADEEKKITTLIKARNIVEAEEAFQAAIKEYPDSDAIRGLHLPLYLVWKEEGNDKKVTAHAIAYLDYNVELLAKNPPNVFGVQLAAKMAAEAFKKSGQGDLGIEKLDATIAAVENRIKTVKKDRQRTLTVLRRELRTNKIVLLLEIGNFDAAAKFIRSELADATKAVEETPDDSERAVDVALLLQLELIVATQTDPENVGQLRAKFTGFITGQIKKHPDSGTLVAVYNSAAKQSVGDVISSNADEAQKRLNEWTAFLDMLDTSRARIKSQVEEARQTISQFKKTLAVKDKRTD
jgi:tetratricopeptide (TPR) repeat protein